jgi:hypothetical protein
MEDDGMGAGLGGGGVQAKAAMSGAAPVAPGKEAPAGRPVAQRRTSGSSLGSVAVTVKRTALP